METKDRDELAYCILIYTFDSYRGLIPLNKIRKDIGQKYIKYDYTAIYRKDSMLFCNDFIKYLLQAFKQEPTTLERYIKTFCTEVNSDIIYKILNQLTIKCT